MEYGDTIYRQQAIDTLWEIRREEIIDGRRFENHCSLSTAVDVIRDLPSAGPKIIYCRDCKYKMLDTSGDEWICSHPSNNAWRITADHYCGYAEGREE